MALKIEVPSKIGDYDIGECLGRGTCGVVYKAYTPDNKPVAIKVSESIKQDSKDQKLSAAQRAFLTEAAAIEKLKHPHIVSLYDAGVEGHLNYLVMEYIDGVSLKHYGKGKALLPPAHVLEIIYECCQALDYSHRRGIIHRDIKPSNIMLTKQGVTKLLDFGIAVPVGRDNSTKFGPSLGTPNYMSSEQILGMQIGTQSDLYSLAAIMFEMLTGEPLFKAKKIKELFEIALKEPAPSLRRFKPELPQELEQLLTKALDKTPGNRYQSGNEMAEAIAQVAEIMQPGIRADSMAKRVQGLRKLPFFEECDDLELDHVALASNVIQAPAGDIILSEGQTDDHFYLITSGIAVMKRDGRIVEVVGQGDCFGEIGFINAGGSLSSIEAVSNVTLYRFEHNFLERLSLHTQLYYYKIFARMVAQRFVAGSDPKLDYVVY